MTMLDDETRRKLRELNLEDFIDAIDAQSKDISYSTMTFEERLKMAVDHLYQSKNNKKVKRLIRMSKFRIPNAAVTSIYYPDRGLDKEKLLSLATCQFIDTNSSIVFQGFTGSGKTYLACAMGKQACISGIRTRYIRVPDLLILRDEATLKEQGITKLLKKFSNYKLLILDEASFAALSLRSVSVSGTMNKLSENLSCGKLQDFFVCTSYARNISFVHSLYMHLEYLRNLNMVTKKAII